MSAMSLLLLAALARSAAAQADENELVSELPAAAAPAPLLPAAPEPALVLKGVPRPAAPDHGLEKRPQSPATDKLDPEKAAAAPKDEGPRKRPSARVKPHKGGA